MKTDTTISIAIAVILFLATLVVGYVMLYLIFLRRKKAKIDNGVPAEEKSSEKGSKMPNKGKAKYAHCELNEIVGYEIIKVKDMTLERQDTVENKTPESEHGTETTQTTQRSQLLSTTGRDGGAVTDDEVPSKEKLEKDRRIREQLRKQEIERLEAERREKQEQKRIEEERKNTFKDTENEDDKPDEEYIQQCLEDYNHFNNTDFDFPVIEEEYNEKLKKVPVDENVEQSPETEMKMNKEQLMEIWQKTELNVDEEKEINDLLNKKRHH